MSKATIVPILPYAPRDPDAVDDNFTALADATFNLNAYNWAEEGLDHRPFQLQVRGERMEFINETTRAAIGIQAAYVQYVHGATVFRTASAMGNADLNTVFRITVHIQVRTTLAAGLGFFAGNTHQFRVVWNDGTTTTALTERRYITNNAALMAPSPGSSNFHLHGTVAFEAWLFSAATKAVSWFELQYISTPALFRASTSVLIVDRFKNCNVTVL